MTLTEPLSVDFIALYRVGPGYYLCKDTILWVNILLFRCTQTYFGVNLTPIFYIYIYLPISSKFVIFIVNKK